MQEIGEILKEKREEKGLSLEDVQQATKIRTRYLEAIESGDLSAIPGMVYARGFIKSYAEFLGLNGQALLEQHEEQQQEERPVEEIREPVKTTVPKRPVLTGQKRTLITQVALGIGAIGLVMIAYTMIVNRSDSGASKQKDTGQTVQQNGIDATPAIPPSSSSTPGDTEQKSQTQVQAKPLEPVSKANGNSFYKVKGDKLSLEVSAPRGDNWMQVHADGKTIASETVKKGQTRTFQANSEIVLITGNSPAIDVKINGQPVVLEQVMDHYEFHFRRD